MSISGTLFFAVNYALIFWGAQHLSAGLGALLASTVPLFGLLVAHHQVPGDGITRRKLAGVLLGVAGVAAIFSSQLGIKSSSAIWGGAAVLLGSFCVALAAVLVKSRGAHLDRGILMAGQMCFALLPLSVIGLIAEGNPLRFNWTSMSLASVVYMALVGTVSAGLMFNWLVKEIAVTKTMLIFLVVPLVAVTLGILFLGERLTFPIAIGGTGILVGVALSRTRTCDRAGYFRSQNPAGQGNLGSDR